MLTPELVDRIQLLIERLRLEDSSLKKGKKKKSSYSIHELKAHDVYFEPSTRLALQFLELEYILYSTEAALRLYRKIITAAMSCHDLTVGLEIGEEGEYRIVFRPKGSADFSEIHEENLAREKASTATDGDDTDASEQLSGSKTKDAEKKQGKKKNKKITSRKKQ